MTTLSLLRRIPNQEKTKETTSTSTTQVLGITLLPPATQDAPSTSSSGAASSTVSGSDSTSSTASTTSTSSTPSTSSATTSTSSSSSSTFSSPTSASLTTTYVPVTSTLTSSHRPTSSAAIAGSTSTSSHSGLSPGLTAFVVIVVLLLIGAVVWVFNMRRALRQREWQFQQHERIFDRFRADKDSSAAYSSTSTLRSQALAGDEEVEAVATAGIVTRAKSWYHVATNQPPAEKPVVKIKRKPVPPPRAQTAQARRSVFGSKPFVPPRAQIYDLTTLSADFKGPH